MQDWTESERDRQAAVLAGKSVVANRKHDKALIAWAEAEGRYVYIGREDRFGRWPASHWHNPFKIGKHGDRSEVIAAYRDHLEHSPGLKLRLPELRGKVLGCWCHPEPCHGDLLCEAVN